MKVKMNQNETMQELDAMEAELFAEAQAEDANLSDEFENPAETVDVAQDNVEPLVESSEDSVVDTEIPQNEDIADQSANEETENLEVNEEDQVVSDNAEDNVLDAEDSDAETEKPLSKAEKDAQRLDRNWQKQEQFKAKNIEEAEQLKRDREEFDKQKAEFEEKNRPPSSKEYRDLAKWYEDRGDYDKAEEAKNMADLAHDREYDEMQKAKTMSVEQQQQAHAEWWKNADDFAQSHSNKDILDNTTAFGQEITKVLNEDPRFQTVPDGFKLAATIAEGRLAVSSLADANERITELESEIKKLNKKTSISNSGANHHNPTPSKRPQSLDDEMDSLLAEARREDARAGV